MLPRLVSLSIMTVHLPNAVSSHHDLHQRQGIRRYLIYMPSTFSFSAIVLVHAAPRLRGRLSTDLCHEQTISFLKGNSVSIVTISSTFSSERVKKSLSLRRSGTYLEYLSSGENRAGWADLVTSPAWTLLRV